ncbi:MAG: MarR family transcriptional regulator [Selenomonadales bacterium]|nr:MarR family transcriptional regulator [Selenomonadales bacterium]
MRDVAKRLIRALYNIDEAYYLNEAKKKLSDAELCVMYALDDGKPHSQREIAQDWLVPKTSVNTIVKRWEKAGLLTLTPIAGKRREMHILLTEEGRAYAKELMGFLYRAEDKALTKTLDKYSDTFIEAIEFFGASLKEAFDEETAVDREKSSV